MAKRNNSLQSKRSQLSKPYDVSNSFVKKVASRVTGYLPQSTSWLSRWLGPSESQESPQGSDPQEESEEEHSQPPSKRLRLPNDSPVILQLNHFRTPNVHAKNEISPIVAQPDKRTQNVVENAIAGPSGLHFKRHIVSSTPTASVGSVSAPLLHPPSCDLSSPQPVKVNCGDNCSESSESSGCSSLVPQARPFAVGQMRRNGTAHRNSSASTASGGMGLAALFPNRPTTQPDLTSLNRRRPSFNVTTLTAPSRFGSSPRDCASTGGISPFYAGRTMYGGASAYRDTSLNLFSPTSRRTGITVRPINSPSQQDKSAGMSSCALRIFDILDQLSTPVLDAKRIPVETNTKRKLPDTRKQYSELHVPCTPDLLRIKRRERIQNSTTAARRTSAAAPSTTMISDQEYKIREDDGISDVKYKGAISSKLRHLEMEVAEEVHLPSLPLPISTLPRIDISVPPLPQPVSPIPVNFPKVTSFAFAPPIPVLSQPEQTLQTVEQFKFSEPLSAKHIKKSDTVSDSNSNLKAVVNFNFIASNKSTIVDKNIEKKGTQFKPAFDLKMGSVMDILKKDSVDTKMAPVFTHSLKKPLNTWECETCMASNDKRDSICCICNEKRLDGEDTDLKVAQRVEQWRCKKCHTFNRKTITTCVNCGLVSQLVVGEQVKPAFTGFGDKFKPASNTWECKECLIRNKADDTTCAACSCPNPNIMKEKPLAISTGFSGMFKKPAGSWECSSCMIQNEVSRTECIACGSIKPGSKPNSSTIKEQALSQNFTFGIPANDSSSFKFGIDNSAQTLLKAKGTKTVQATFGVKVETENVFPKDLQCTSGLQPTSLTPNFTFGVPETTGIKTSDESKFKTSSVTEGENKPKNNDVPSFQFGFPQTESVSLLAPNLPKEGKISKKRMSSEGMNESDSKKTVPAKLNTFTFGKPIVTGATSETVNNLISVSSSLPLSTIETGFGGVSASSIPDTSLFQFGSSVLKNETTQNQNTPQLHVNINSSEKIAKPFECDTEKNMLKKAGNHEEKLTFDAPKQDEYKSPAFSFGLTAKDASFGASVKTENKISSSFNSPSNNLQSCSTVTSSEQKASTFGLLSSGDKSVFGGMGASSSSLFGATPADKMSAASPFSSFGRSSLQSTTTDPAKPAAFSFSGSAPVVPASSNLNMFAFNTQTTQNNSSTSKPQGFQFSASQQQPTREFAFTPLPAAVPATAASFNFNSSATPSTFGAQSPAAAPVFGSCSNPSFLFGSATSVPSDSAPTPVFGFAQVAPVVSTAAQQPAQPATMPTFVFGQSLAPAAAPPAFNPNVRPTFNFTGGSTPTFTAAPSVGGATALPRKDRVIKKAVRRTARPDQLR